MHGAQREDFLTSKGYTYIGGFTSVWLSVIVTFLTVVFY